MFTMQKFTLKHGLVALLLLIILGPGSFAQQHLYEQDLKTIILENPND